MELRIGNGFDVHPFKKGRPLYLGGVKIPYRMGLAGYSDADALIHSICDAILGAFGKGDIGKMFPNTDKRYKDARSTLFLKKMNEIVKRSRSRISNLDCIVVAEEPKISPYAGRMIAQISKYLGVQRDRINIKATTSEGLGFTGRKEGIACISTVLVVKNR